MPEFTLEDVRRLYMIQSLFPKSTWEWKQVCYARSAIEHNRMSRSVTSLKSYWNSNNYLWEAPGLLVDPPPSIPTDLLGAQNQRNLQTNSTAQDPGLLGATDEQRHHSKSFGEHSGGHALQDEVQQNLAPAEYPTTYELLRGQIQEDQQNVQFPRLPANFIYSQYPMHSVPTALAGTTHGNPHIPSSSSEWIVSPGGSVSVSTEEQPLNLYSAGSSFNTFAACNPNFTSTPQIMRFQVNEPRFFGQNPEENLATHNVNVEGNVTDEESSEEDSDSGIEEESQMSVATTLRGEGGGAA